MWHALHEAEAGILQALAKLKVNTCNLRLQSTQSTNISSKAALVYHITSLSRKKGARNLENKTILIKLCKRTPDKFSLFIDERNYVMWFQITTLFFLTLFIVLEIVYDDQEKQCLVLKQCFLNQNTIKKLAACFGSDKVIFHDCCVSLSQIERDTYLVYITNTAL